MHFSILTTLAFIALSTANPLITKRGDCNFVGGGKPLPCTPGEYTCQTTKIAVCKAEGGWQTTAFCGAQQRCVYAQGIPVCKDC